VSGDRDNGRMAPTNKLTRSFLPIQKEQELAIQIPTPGEFLPYEPECEYHFLATAGLGEVAGTVATRTAFPLMRESDGLTMTLSDGVTP